MYALDFEYDGQCLSDLGFIICTLGGSSDFDRVSAGANISFNTVPRHRGKINSLVGTVYEETISAQFDICKNPDLYDDLHIYRDEHRAIMRWLNRNEFLKFRLLDAISDESDICYYNASFNVEKVLVARELYALELTMETNMPFGFGQERKYTWEMTDASKPVIFKDESDEIGYLYPSMVITCNGTGTLTIRNEKEDSLMEIKNCTPGEVISIDGASHIITSSLNAHKLYDDFNFEFLRIGNTYNDRVNKITSSLPCTLELSYCPIIKDSPDL